MARSCWLMVLGLVIVCWITFGATGYGKDLAVDGAMNSGVMGAGAVDAGVIDTGASDRSKTIHEVADVTDITVAVLEFKGTGYVNISVWLRDRIVSGIPQMIAGRLLHEPGVRVLERDRINEIMQEHRLQSSQSVDEHTAIQLGRLVGADIIVMGTLSEIGIESGGGVGVGRFQLSTSTAKVRLSGRLINVETGELVAAIESQGQNTGTGVSVRNMQGLSYDGKDFQDSTIGKALDEAIDDFVTQFRASLEGVRKKLGEGGARLVSEGRVVGTRGDYIVVDLGQMHGVQTKSQLRVERLEHIEGLSAPIHIPVATLEVLSVDGHASVATVKESREPIAIGDRVEIQR